MHGNAKLTPAGRRILLGRIAAGRPVAHVAAERGERRFEDPAPILEIREVVASFIERLDRGEAGRELGRAIAIEEQNAVAAPAGHDHGAMAAAAPEEESPVTRKMQRTVGLVVGMLALVELLGGVHEGQHTRIDLGGTDGPDDGGGSGLLAHGRRRRGSAQP